MLGVGGHLTDSGIHINSDRAPVGTPTRGPDPFQCFPQGLVHLADMTPCERTKKRAQCGRGHHPKTAAPCRWNRPAADQHDQYGTRPPASMPPKTAPCDPDTLLPGDLPAVRSRPATVPNPTGTSRCPLQTTPRRQPTTRHRMVTTPNPVNIIRYPVHHKCLLCLGDSSYWLLLFSQVREALHRINPPPTTKPTGGSRLRRFP